MYLLPGAKLNQMLTLAVEIKLEMPSEPELLLFAGMNDHLLACGRASGAPERRGTNAQEDLGSDPDIVRRDQ